jgi:hypothetical protein
MAVLRQVYHRVELRRGDVREVVVRRCGGGVGSGVVGSVVDTGRYNPRLRNEWRVEAGRRRERRGVVEGEGEREERPTICRYGYRAVSRSASRAYLFGWEENDSSDAA